MGKLLKLHYLRVRGFPWWMATFLIFSNYASVSRERQGPTADRVVVFTEVVAVRLPNMTKKRKVLMS